MLSRKTATRLNRCGLGLPLEKYRPLSTGPVLGHVSTSDSGTELVSQHVNNAVELEQIYFDVYKSTRVQVIELLTNSLL